MQGARYKARGSRRRWRDSDIPILREQKTQGLGFKLHDESSWRFLAALAVLLSQSVDTGHSVVQMY